MSSCTVYECLQCNKLRTVTVLAKPPTNSRTDFYTLTQNMFLLKRALLQFCLVAINNVAETCIILVHITTELLMILKCCSACALPHLYAISHHTKFLNGYAMAQVSRCWPLSVETGFNARPAHMESPLDKEALEQIFLRSILAFHQCSIHQQYTLSN